MVVLRESDKVFEGELNMDGLIGVSRCKLGRNSKIECEPWHRLGTSYCFDSVLNPNWGRAYLGCALGDEVI